jgi:hypothetical protein
MPVISACCYFPSSRSETPAIIYRTINDFETLPWVSPIVQRFFSWGHDPTIVVLSSIAKITKLKVLDSNIIRLQVAGLWRGSLHLVNIIVHNMA